jgi:YfiH family protein
MGSGFLPKQEKFRVQQHTNGDITWFQFAHFAELAPMVTHGIFARQGGVSAAPYATLNCGLSVGDDPTHVAENRARVVATLPDHLPLVTAHPIHGTNVVEVLPANIVDPAALSSHVGVKADAMITQARGIGLFWAYADCTPILIVDPAHEAIALVHAGWRGTSGAVVVNALHALHEHYGTQPDAVYVGIGPSIGPCCYEVDEPVRAAFDAHPIARQHTFFSTVMVQDDHGDERPSLRLDVAAANYAQLRASGVRADHIEQSDLCTGHRRDLFFSHRMEHSHTGRFAVVIGLR